MVVAKLDELFERDSTNNPAESSQTLSPDDYKECNYLLRTTSNIISTLSHNGWITLLTHTLDPNEKRPDVPKSEGRLSLLVQGKMTCR